jgi:hypothetical protein
MKNIAEILHLTFGTYGVTACRRLYIITRIDGSPWNTTRTTDIVYLDQQDVSFTCASKIGDIYIIYMAEVTILRYKAISSNDMYFS